jgi:5S rRNA maturation endonuclease (ribonuclease M5)
MKKFIWLIAFFITISFPTVINVEGQTDCKTLQKIFETDVALE